ncbi:MAG: glycoside hydrolase family 88 protein [Clostridia bacterium]|nr:glycoside hydrolase family 88 protein [Clostridia bacterium]
MNYNEIAKLVMSRLVATKDGGMGNPEDHMNLSTWEWPQGVAVYAMMKVYLTTRSESDLEDIRSWYAAHIERGLPVRNINTTAPMLALTLLYEETHDETYRPLIEDWANWVMTGLPRTQEGGFQHITTHDINEEQLWDDTLFMTVLFLYRAGVALGRRDWREEAKYQFLLHIKYLHAQKTGLWYHGFCFIGRHHFGEAYWARGNSWFTAGAVDFLEWLEQDEDTNNCVRVFILNAWREQCLKLVELQDKESGLWHTLLDHPDSYLETSASAAIAYGLLKGVRLGLLEDECRSAAELALKGVIAQIGEDGIVQGVSYGTPMGHDLDFYRTIPIQATAYGQGLTFLMLTEAMREQDIPN